MNDTKRFVFIEQYKIYSDYEGDNTVTTINENIFRKIISTDNEVCKYAKNVWNNRVTCIGFAKKCNNFNAELYQIQCTDIKLEDNSK